MAPTGSPVTRAPTTLSPGTQAPTTSSPTTLSPTTLSPGTQAPTTGAPSAAPTTSTPSAAPTEWSFDGINLRPPTLTSPGLQEIDTDLALGTPFVTIVATHPSGNAGTITYSIAPTTAVAEADRRARRSEITTPFNISETDGSVFTAAALTPGNLTVVVTATVTVGTVSNSSAITLPVLVVQGPNSANSDAASSDDESMGGGGVAAIVLVILACFALLMFLMFKQVRDNNRSRKDPGIDNPTYAGDVLTNPVYADAGKVADESMYADASGTRAGAVPNQNYAPLGRDGLATNPNYAPAERRPEAAADGEGLYGTPINDQQQHYADLEGEAYRDVAPNPAGEDGDTYKDVAPTPAGNSAADDEAYGYLAAEGATNDPYMDPAPTKTNAAVADEGNLYGEVLPAGAVASMPSRVPPALPAAAPPSTASMPYDNYADGEADGMYAAPAVMAAGPSTITYDAATAASHTPGSTARPTSIILGEDGTFHPSNTGEFGNTRRTSLEFMNTGTKMMRRTATVRGRVFMKMSEPDDADAIAAEFNQPGGLVWKRWFWCVHCTTRLRERAPARSVPWPGQRPRIHSRLPSLGRLLPRPTALLCPVLTAVCARTCHLGPAW